MSAEHIIIIAEGIVIIGLIVALVVVCGKYAPRGRAKADNVKIIRGARYTENKNETTADGDVNVTHRVGDAVLERGVAYVARKGGAVIPGKYTVLSAAEGVDKFNIRVGGLVREYKHASDIVLAEGEEVCAVSHTVIFR
jgi:hypothetical protein